MQKENPTRSLLLVIKIFQCDFYRGRLPDVNSYHFLTKKSFNCQLRNVRVICISII